MYERRSRLRKRTRDRLIEHFVAGTTARPRRCLWASIATRWLRSTRDIARACRGDGKGVTIRRRSRSGRQLLRRRQERQARSGCRWKSPGLRAFEKWREGLHSEDPECLYAGTRGSGICDTSSLDNPLKNRGLNHQPNPQ